jgi:serine/threonine protein kinase
VDWWATGILLYELVCGCTPFQHGNKGRLFRNIVEGEVRFAVGMNEGVKQFIEMVLVKDAKKRATFRELKDALLFEGLNWEDVLGRKIQPSCCVKNEGGSHLVNFDEEFTQEQALDSNVMPVMDSNERVLNFSFEGKSPLHESDEFLMVDAGGIEMLPEPSTIELIDTL